MYKQFYNAYEKKAEEIRRAANEAEVCAPVERHPVAAPQAEKKECSEKTAGLAGLAEDDLLLLGAIFLLMNSEKKDKLLIVILGYLFFAGL